MAGPAPDFAALHPGYYEAGIRNVNCVSAAVDVTSIAPPWARAISDAM